ncbi:MAG: lysophospholipase, partial [Flavobacteriales bacterium]|nr:lysophospholipase [Flavobacteriales bacterium]
MKKGRLRRRVLRIVIALTLIILVGGYIVFQHIAPYAIIKPARANCSHLSLDAYDLQVESLTLETKDQIELKGYWIQTKQDSIRGVMILVHGIGGCKESFLSLANRLANRGIASVLFDNRAHGQSSGQYSTYGFYEKKDISRIIDHIKEQDN